MCRQFGEVAEQPVSQGAVGAAGRGVHGQVRGFVQHRQFVVAIQHGNFALFRAYAVRGRGGVNTYNIAGDKRRFGREADRAVTHGKPGADGLLDLFA